MRVLFLCGHNAGRSIAAEAIARQIRPDLVVGSAGTTPSLAPNPLVLEALESRGIPTRGLFSKGLGDVGGMEDWDLVVTMGCMENACPTIPPGKKNWDWGLPDPASNPHLLSEILDRIATKVATL
ncbi:arsenate reductase ArsC [bacterium]|nr:arsenate reductase ArsC [bacterium]